MIHRTGYADLGCRPIQDSERIAVYKDRLRASILRLKTEEEMQAAERDIAARVEAGIAIQKALKKRKRFKIKRPAKPKQTNVTTIRRRA